jgi:hypothetical protein
MRHRLHAVDLGVAAWRQSHQVENGEGERQ